MLSTRHLRWLTHFRHKQNISMAIMRNIILEGASEGHVEGRVDILVPSTVSLVRS